MASPLVAAAQTAGVRINEFLAANVSIHPDNADFDDYSDWIELHNPTAAAVDLRGYYLTDDLSAPTKWAFPAGANLAAGGYLVVRADGFSAGPGETHVRGYYPWGSTFVTRRYHAAFKLSADGEEIGLFRAEAPPTESVLIAKNSVWRYHDLGTDPGAGWTTSTYDDAVWASGSGVLGYGDTWVSTRVGYGASASAKYAATYFRRRFTLPVLPALVSDVKLRLMVDDGAVVYLNGVEVARLRMPAGAVGPATYSGRLAPVENVYELVEIDADALVAGDNVLAVSVHQENGTSSDLSFDAELVVAALAAPPTLVDSVVFGPQRDDVSQGRDPAAPANWRLYGIPSPGAANTDGALSLPIRTAAAPTASLPSGFYGGAQTVVLSGAGEGETIRYTLDGSDPVPSSPVYGGPIEVASTTIVRARIFANGAIPGPVLTRSYFLGEDAAPGLPLVSLVADPATLFGAEIGIYDNDTVYPFKGREVPARIEFFEQDRSPAFSVSAGIRIAGENIWLKAQKPFTVYCRSKYGDDAIPYQVFPGEPSARVAELNLRNGGDDWEETLLRDAMMPAVLRGRMDAGLYSYRPSVLHLNGRFWGIYNLRKRFDASYFSAEHRLGEGDYDLVQHAHDSTGATVIMAEAGTTEAYEALLAYVAANNPASDAVYDQVADQVNLDSFIDYVIATDFAVNTSWSHNREFWRARKEGAKWRWIVNDFDRGFDDANLAGSLIDDFRSGYPLFARLDNNPRFVNRLLQRYAVQVATTFAPGRFNAILDGLVAEQEAEIQRHIARWGTSGGIASLTTRRAQIDEIKRFVADRPASALARLQTELGVSRPMGVLSYAVLPSGGGRIEAAGVSLLPETGGSASVFLNTPIELRAVASPGYVFTGWSSGETSPAIVTTLLGATTLTAHFQPGGETVLPAQILGLTTLTEAGSPYVVNDGLTVAPGGVLNIGPGVVVRLTEGASILVRGALNAAGTAERPVRFEPRDGGEWGCIGFSDTTAVSTLAHAVIRGATTSRQDPANLKGAISGLRASIVLEHVDIEGPQPIFARGGSVILRDSKIRITFTGDGINLKGSAGLVERSEFQGVAAVDTDAIDYDGVVDGVIRDNRIFLFRGENNDGIDVGEGCTNLLVSGNRIYHCLDKGVSVGQGSDVRIEDNLIVGCGIGVAVKDAGSVARVDQTTFAGNGVGVAAYEKNLGVGGGTAFVTNSILSRSGVAPVTVDALSMVSVSYSISDTVPLAGASNRVVDPLFTRPGIYDFSLRSASPARNSGDPAHALDPDGTRADVGMAYVYSAADYPFLTPDTVLITEVLAHSDNEAPDWIELHNRGTDPIDLGGWYLSDDEVVPLKYRIAAGTMIPAGGYVVFYQNLHFGAGSGDPGALIPFALSENGETVRLHRPASGIDLDYDATATFGPATRGVSAGRHVLSDGQRVVFVAMAAPTPGAPNTLPKVGPVVISEVMYHPASTAAAEYIELLNISADPVTLVEPESGLGWAFTAGIAHTFPTAVPVVMQPGARIILTRDLASFNVTYAVAPGTRVLQWTSGSLDNAGEAVELSIPGDLDGGGVRQYIRADRVAYDDVAPWPTLADGAGPALERINVYAYGDDVGNWTSATASPGSPVVLPGYLSWSHQHGLASVGEAADSDGDGWANLAEYAFNTSPVTPSEGPKFEVGQTGGQWWVDFVLAAERPDLVYAVEFTENLSGGSWTRVSDTAWVEDGGTVRLRVLSPFAGDRIFCRLVMGRR